MPPPPLALLMALTTSTVAMALTLNAAAPPTVAIALTLNTATPPAVPLVMAPRITLPEISSPTLPGSPKGPSEYQLNLGKVVDALRYSYPTILEREPDDLSVFRHDLTLTGVGPTIAGMKDYRRLLAGLRLGVGAASSSSEVTYRLMVSGSAIRVRWCAKVWLRDPTFELRSLLQHRELKPMQIDGVSIYELDDAARIIEHRIEHVELSGGAEEDNVVQTLLFREMAAVCSVRVQL
mgnify:CR=1 FL=1